MSQMQQYHDLVQTVLDNGYDIVNERTGMTCRTIIGSQLTFDIGKGFPALTTRKLPFKNIRGELLGFFRGYTSAKDFREIGCNFWTKNANETTSWLNSPYRKDEDDCGDIYGKQWTSWETMRVSKSVEEDSYLQANGWEFVGLTGDRYEYFIYRKHINQLEKAVKTILTDPSDRRIIVNGWNFAEMDKMSLPACHCTYMFIPDPTRNKLHVVMWQRSADLYLGSPANIASTSIFLATVARLTGYNPGQVIIQMANVHLYENQLEVAKELIRREHFPEPKLVLSDNIKKIENMEDIKGCFTRIQPEDICLEGYQSHEALTVEMVA